MSLTILDPTVAAAVAAATSQDAQRTALIAPWAGGDVTVRAMNGAVLRETMTYGPFALLAGPPRSLTLGALIARTVSSTGAPTHFVFRAGSTDIFSMTGAVAPAAGDIVLPAGSGGITALARTNLSDPVVGKVTVSANPALPVSGVTATAFTLALAASSGFNGSQVGVTVTPNGPIPPGGLSVTLAASNGGVLGSTALSFTSGSSSAQATTLQRNTTGASVVTMTNNGGLANNGSGATYSSVDVAAPPPPPPPAGTIASVGVVSAVGGAVPFDFGHVFAPGHLPSGTNLAGLQTDVLTRWPDNSASFARVSGVVTGTASVSAAVNLQAGTAASGAALTLANLKAAMSQPVVIGFGAYGSLSWSNTDWDTPFEVVSVGPLSSKWVFRRTLPGDPHLSGLLTVTLFADGNAVVKPRVEATTLMVAAPSSKSAIYTFTMGGTLRYSSGSAIDLPHHGWIDLINGSDTGHWLTAQHHNKYRHDGEYMMASGMVPAYRAKTPATASSVTSLPASYVPLAQDRYPSGMGAGGYSPAIGLLPEWDVVHMTAEGADTYRQILWMASNAGRYGLGYRDETAAGAEQNRPALVKNFPTLQIRYPTSVADAGYVQPPVTTGTTGAGWASSHHPSIGFMAYLLTADPFHRDALHFANTMNSLGETAAERVGASGIWKSHAAGATRHVAWCLRTLAQSIAATPDSMTEYKAALRAQYQANVDYYWGRYINQSHNPYGFVTPYSDYTTRQPTVAAGATASVIPCNPGQLGGAPYTFSQDGQYVGMTATIGGETRTISAYNAATETISVSAPFSAAPSAGAVMSVRDGKTFDAPWMGNFLIAALGYAKDLSLGLDATRTARFEAFYAWKARTVIGMLGFINSNEFCYRDYGQYSICVAPFDSPGAPKDDTRWSLGTGPWHTSWGHVWSDTFSGANSPVGDTYPPWAVPAGGKTEGALRQFVDPEFPSAEALPAISYAYKHNLPGAEGAYQRLTSAPNWYIMENGMDAKPVHAVTPFRLGTWRRGLARFQWTRIVGTAQSALAASRGGVISFGGDVQRGANTPARKNSYSGAGFHRNRRLFFNWGGGHGDYFGNELIAINLRDDAPAWAELAPGSAAQDFPALVSGSVFVDMSYVGYTLVGCTTSRIFCFGVSSDHIGKGIVINGETTTVTAIDIQGHYMDVSPPLSNPPASRVDITRASTVYKPDTYDKGQVLTRYRDKLPTSKHSYYGLQAFEREAHNTLISANGSASPQGTGTDPTDAYALATPGNAGILEFGTYPFSTGGVFGGTSGNIVPSTCKHPCTEVLYSIIAQRLHIVTPSLGGPTSAPRSGGTYTSVSLASYAAFNPGSYTSTAIDTRNDRLFWCNPAVPHTISLAPGAGQYVPTARTLTGDPALLDEFAALAPEGLGLVYDPCNHAYYARARAAGSKVYVIDAATFALTLMPAVGGVFPPASAGSSSGAGHGIYNGLQLDPEGRGMAYQPDGAADMWYCRLR